MREGSRLESLLSLCPRYVVVPPNPPDGIAFCLAGNIQDWEHMFELHDGISNCKPGIWKAEVKYIEGAERGDCDREGCLRWVADLNDETELDFTIAPDEWQAWEQMFKDKFDDAVKWDEDIAWTHAGTYFNDGGTFNIISTAYLTREAAVMIQEGDNLEEMDDDEWGCYLETIANNEEPINEEDMVRNEDFTLGGFHCKFQLVNWQTYILYAYNTMYRHPQQREMDRWY